MVQTSSWHKTEDRVFNNIHAVSPTLMDFLIPYSGFLPINAHAEVNILNLNYINSSAGTS